MKKKTSIRLLKHIQPLHYEITLKPDLEAHTFLGEETITINIDKIVSEITLHSKDLDIMSAAVILGKEEVLAKKISYNDKLEITTFVFPKRIAKGKIKLHIHFRGIL